LRGELSISDLFKIVNDDFFADWFEDFFNKFNVHRVRLVIVLGFLAFKDDIECNLVGLVDHGPMARRHPADVKMQDSREGFEMTIGPVDEFVGSLWVGWISPKDHNMRKHARESSGKAGRVSRVCLGRNSPCKVERSDYVSRCLSAASAVFVEAEKRDVNVVT